jgi:hypothetical protein
MPVYPGAQFEPKFSLAGVQVHLMQHILARTISVAAGAVAHQPYLFLE